MDPILPGVWVRQKKILPIINKIQLMLKAPIIAVLILLGCFSFKISQASSNTGSLLQCYDFSSGGDTVIELPPILREISGLAFTADDILLAHNDEQAKVYQLHLNGEIVPILADRQPGLQLDFEGIAVFNSRVHLVTSKGKLVSGSLHYQNSPFTQWDTGLGEKCEIEGMDYISESKHLVFVCKKIKQKISKREIKLLLLKSENGTATTREISAIIPGSEESEKGQGERKKSVKSFNGSGVLHVPGVNRFLVLSSNSRAIAELSIEGKLLAIQRLKKKHHKQPEGIEITANGNLIIANEGKEKSGYLTVYKLLEDCSVRQHFARTKANEN
jgi:uncharacterized protein YjiK